MTPGRGRRPPRQTEGDRQAPSEWATPFMGDRMVIQFPMRHPKGPPSAHQTPDCLELPSQRSDRELR